MHLRLQLRRQQRRQQAQAQFTRFDAFVALLVLIDHGVDARAAAIGIHAARLAEAHFLAGDVLQLNGHVLQHVPQPGALLLFRLGAVATQPAHKAAGGGKAASVCVQAGQRSQQAVDEGGAQARCRPLLELAEIEHQLDDRKVRVERRADVDVAFEDFQAVRSHAPAERSERMLARRYAEAANQNASSGAP